MTVTAKTLQAPLLAAHPNLFSVFWRCGVYLAGLRYPRDLTVGDLCKICLVDEEHLIAQLNRRLIASMQRQ